MKSFSATSLRRSGVLRPHGRLMLAALAIAGAALMPRAHAAQTALADQPLFSVPEVPGNLALVLSVEFPTAVSVAHTNRTYSSASQYLGYFDPNKCYFYHLTDGTTVENYFQPVGLANSHICPNQWSGNFLNWASMQTIDPFRWALTGGYRVIDEASRTVIEKAWATGQGGTGNFPDSTISSSDIAGATPFPATTPTLAMRIQGLGNKMWFTVPDTGSGGNFQAQYFNGTNLSGAAVLSRTETSIAYNISTVWPPGVSTTNMSAKWVGTVVGGAAGNYQFLIRGDDGVRLTVDSQPLIGGADVGWVNQGATNYLSPVMNVEANHTFQIEVQYFQGNGGAEVSLQWQRPGDAGFSIIGGSVASLYSTATPYNGISTGGGVVYETFMRAQVCDPTSGHGGVETNCTAYGSNYKPEGLMQKYANKIRYSTFGYLNDSNILRDGGVLRAKMKFVGPLQPVPGSASLSNSHTEWSGSTGIFTLNPDDDDAANTAAIFGPIANSGVINYLNKFGEVTPGSYKTYDNVSELYYAAIRYFKNMPDVPEWSAVGSADSNTKTVWADGFPVITNTGAHVLADPILYSCQRNFILGIGDTNTHADKNVPGNSQTNEEPTLPSAVSADQSVNAVTATNTVGTLEGLGNIGSGSSYNGDANSATIAGLAFDSHVNDIRPDDPVNPMANTTGKQTIDTYWVDVQEYQQYAHNNQFYLATKYGGFTVPAGYDSTNPVALQDSWWHTNTDMVDSSQKRPDNYYSGGQPDLMQAGLNAAFAKISEAISQYTTSFSTALPQLATAGNSSFASSYDPNTWTGEVAANNLSIDVNNSLITETQTWTFSSKLAAQAAVTGWHDNRRVVTINGTTGVPFEIASLSSAQVSALDTSYVSNNDSANFLAYLRGDTSNEIGSTTSGSTLAYRQRSKLVGDIVNSKPKVNGPPSFPYSDATNPGYAAFKALWSTRRSVVFIGANDGMLHAINGALYTTTTAGSESDASAGTEMFAYIPNALFAGPNGTPNVDGLASLGNPAFVHHYMVNASPDVDDIDFGRVLGGNGVADWRSVLIGGLGKGGRSYYAMDVTDPVGMVTGGESAVASKVLWEFTDSTMGYTYGDPLVIKTRKYGWVVVFTSGYNNADGIGYLYFVNPKTGALIEKVSTGAGSTTNSAGLATATAFITDSTDGTADAIYAGDLLGNLWRLDVTAPLGTTAPYGAPVLMAQVTGASNIAQPITTRPVVSVDPASKNRYVMFGTGKLLDVTDIASKDPQSFYAIVDGTNARFNPAPGTPQNFPFTRSMFAAVTDLNGITLAGRVGWYVDLGLDATTGVAWRLNLPPETFFGTVQFAPTLPNADVCTPGGTSNIYDLGFGTGKSYLLNTDGQVVAYLPAGGLVTDLETLSVGGTAVLAGGKAKDAQKQIYNTLPPAGLTLRRLNWRELQTVD